MSNIAKSTGMLMIGTIIAKILGFSRELVLASVYGATKYSDAYLIAITIPTVIFASIGASVSTTLIPMFCEIEQEHGEKEALKFTNNIINIIILLCTVIIAIGLLFTEEIVKLFAVGFTNEVFKITVQFVKIVMIGIVFTGLSYVMTSYLQLKNNFTIPGLIAIPKNIIIIISIILSVKLGAFTMIWGYLLAMLSEFLFQLPFAMKNGYKYSTYINIKDKYIKNTVYLLGPVMIGMAVNQINTMIDKSLASTLVEGSISALTYANKLNDFVIALFITSIVSVIYPSLSKLSTEDNKAKFIKFIQQSINFVLLLVLPISVGAMVLSKPIVQLLFERGQFDSRATNMTSIALIMYSVGMVAFGLREILCKVFYSLKDTKTPMINGSICVLINVILNIVLVKVLGLAGLALASSISAIVCIILLFRSLNKKIGNFGQDKIIKTLAKSMFSSVIMGIISYYSYKLISNIFGIDFMGNLISLCGSIFIGVLVYMMIIILLKVDEVNIAINMISEKLKNKNKKLTIVE